MLSQHRRGLAGAIVLVVAMLNGSAAAAQDSAAKFRVERDLVYAKPGDSELLLDAYLPAGDADSVPAVLVVHGGAWRSGSKTQLALYAAALARRGYAAFAINYRLAPENHFPAQIEDCRSAVRWIRKNAAKYGVDTERIGAIGYSAGAHLVTLLACTSNDEANRDTHVHAVVAGGAPCDFRESPKNSRGLAFWLGGPRGELPDVYAAASPAAFVTEKAPPMFFFNGENDLLVKPSSPEAMVKALQGAKVEASLYIVPGGGHIGAALDSDALDKAWKFLDKHLMVQPTEAEK